MGNDEKRQPGHHRNAVSLVVDYEGATDLCDDYTENLSSGGTFVHTERSFEVGDTINLQLSFPRLLAPLAILGKVRWVRSGSKERSGVGIEFVNFDEKARLVLEEILEKVKDKNPNYVQPSLRVLLVEDNPHITRLMRDGLGSGRYTDSHVECVAVSNGKKALEFLSEEAFDVVLIDVNLPVISGATVISIIREQEGSLHLPIIAVSAGGEDARKAALDAGADFFIYKPMRLREIFATIQKLLDP